jgi:quinol monooxygenase YgiN
MSELQVTARLRIHDGKLEEFKRIAGKCMDSVRTRDTGTLQYDFFFSGDNAECVVQERYRDSDAVLEHMANLGETMGELLETCAFSVDIFGTPSSELTGGLEGFDVRIYSPFQSLS